MHKKRITVFGGSGFLGSYLVKQLVEQGALVRVVCRHPDRAASLVKNYPAGSVTITAGNICDEQVVINALAQADVVVNLVGILFQRGAQRFEKIQADSAGLVAQCAKAAGVKAFVQLSALGVDRVANSQYAASKLKGEQAVLQAFPEAVILRPSVIFGIADDFFNRFASLLSIAPLFPLIGGGKTKFQPVFVEDVAKAICHAITQPEACGQVYELGGPEVMSMAEILRYVKSQIKSRTFLYPMPFFAASLVATVLQLLPTPMLTRDQVRLLKADNIVGDKTQGLSELGVVHPKRIDQVVPGYLKRYARK